MAVAIPLRSGARSQSEGALTAALYKQHAGELLRFAWHRLGRLEDAEDAVQATFLSAHRVLAEGERVREPRAWLFRILRNECLTRIAMTKRRGIHEELGEWHADSSASVADRMESNDEFDVAVALLATLPEQQREAMVLREWLGMSAIETADVLDVTPQGVDALVYRARKALVGLAEVEEESACGVVRQALADAKINSKIRAHLLTCRSCRSAARRLHAPEEMAAANGFLPLDSIAARLGESIPGFAVAGGAVAAAGGGAAAAGIVGSIAAGTAVKVVATVAVGAVVATGVAREAPAIRDAIGQGGNVQQVKSMPAGKAPVSNDGTKRIAAPQPARDGAVAPVSAASSQPAEGGAAVVAAAAPAAAEPASDIVPVAAVGEPVAAAVPPVEAPLPAAVSAPAEESATEDGAAPATPAKPPVASQPSTPAKPPVASQPSTPAKPPVVSQPSKPSKPPVVSQPSSDAGKKAAEAAAEQAKRQAEQAKKAAEAAAELAKKNAAAAAAAAEDKPPVPARSEGQKGSPTKGDGTRNEAPKPEGSKVTPPKTEAPKPEGSKVTPPKTEAPKPEGSKVTPPKTEAPKPEGSKVTPPKTEAPKPEGSKETPPKTEGSKVEAPKPPAGAVVPAPTPSAPAAATPPVVPAQPAADASKPQNGKDRDKGKDRDRERSQ